MLRAHLPQTGFRRGAFAQLCGENSLDLVYIGYYCRLTGNPEVIPQTDSQPRCPEVGIEDITVYLLQARLWPTSGADNSLDRPNRAGRDTSRCRLTVYAAYGWASNLSLLIPFLAACFLKPQAPIHT